MFLTKTCCVVNKGVTWWSVHAFRRKLELGLACRAPNVKSWSRQISPSPNPSTTSPLTQDPLQPRPPDLEGPLHSNPNPQPKQPRDQLTLSTPCFCSALPWLSPAALPSRPSCAVLLRPPSSAVSCVMEAFALCLLARRANWEEE